MKLQYFGHLIQSDFSEKTLMLEMIEGRRRRGRQRVKWLVVISNSTDMSLSKLRVFMVHREAWCFAALGVTKSWIWLNDWTELNSTLISLTKLFIVPSRTLFFVCLFFVLLLISALKITISSNFLPSVSGFSGICVSSKPKHFSSTLSKIKKKQNKTKQKKNQDSHFRQFIYITYSFIWSFPGGSGGKSACIAEDSGSIPELRRSLWGRI